MAGGTIHIDVEQGGDDWLRKRGIITASSVAQKIGCSTKGWARDALAHHDDPPQRREEIPPEDPRSIGHREEEPIARRMLRILFPRREMMACNPDQDPLRTCGIYVRPESRKWLTASPDRDLPCHPEPNMIAEIKCGVHMLYLGPLVDHLFQTETQMHVKGVDFMFLTYGDLEDNTAVFLVQYSPELWDWMTPRMATYVEVYLSGRREFEPGEMPEIGWAVKDLWEVGGSVDSVLVEKLEKVLGPGATRQPGFFPPMPRWELVGFQTGGRRSDYWRYVRLWSLAGGADPDVFHRSIGVLWEKIGVTVCQTHRDSMNPRNFCPLSKLVQHAASM